MFQFTYLCLLIAATAFLLSLAFLAIYMPFIFVADPQQCMTVGVTLIKCGAVLLILDIWGVYFEFYVVDQSRRTLKEAQTTTEVTPVEIIQKEGEENGDEIKEVEEV
jgi:hypothetical protein